MTVRVPPVRAGLRGVPALALLACLSACAPSAAPVPAIRIEISHVVGDQPLQLGEAHYKTPGGNDYSLTKLRYYLSNFRLRQADGHWFQPSKNPQSADGYFLVDEADPASKQFALPHAPAGEYEGIEFLIGIDAARNHAGAQTGALDPVRGMFWMWNTGYIFLKLEGRSPVSPAADGKIEYHIGGGDDLARTVYLPLSPKRLRVAAGIQPVIHLDADIGTVFGGARPLDIAATPAVMDARDGTPVADAYAGMFRVDHLHYEPLPATQ